jgi:hypothetical protein
MFYLVFTNLEGAYPFSATVRVSWRGEVYESQLVREPGIVVTAERCFAFNSDLMLNSLLHELAAARPVELTENACSVGVSGRFGLVVERPHSYNSNMSSNDATPECSDDVSPFRGAEAWDIDDILDGGLFDYRSLPLTVDETLLEVELSGPGSEAIRLLETLSDRHLDEDQLLQVASAWERQGRWLTARTQAANVAFVGAADETSLDGMREQTSRTLELALATDCNDTFLKQTLGTARALATTLSATGSAMESGELSTYRARRIAEKLNGLDPQVAQAIEAKVLPTAARLKMGSLLAKLRKLVLAARGEDAVEEHLQGVADRRVRIETQPSQPGLLDLHASLPAETTIAIRTALEDKAKDFARADKIAYTKAKEAGQVPEPRRTRDQRLADALAWFVLGPDAADPHQPARPKIAAHVTISLPTLLHLRDNPGELQGYGPIPADIARMLAEDADWQRFVFEPVTGHLLDVGDQVYVQPAKLRTFTQFRDVKDRFPGSQRSAFLGDGDHIKPFDRENPGHGGRTAADNIACLSRIGHIAKTHNGWTCEGDANGILTWTSPRGQTYETAPHDYSDHDDLGPPPF